VRTCSNHRIHDDDDDDDDDDEADEESSSSLTGDDDNDDDNDNDDGKEDSVDMPCISKSFSKSMSFSKSRAMLPTEALTLSHAMDDSFFCSPRMPRPSNFQQQQQQSIQFRSLALVLG
jgi:hypothetical protein